jgi:hypothetical protein
MFANAQTLNSGMLKGAKFFDNAVALGWLGPVA